ncbi:hypothetical protein FB645_004239 [Coemansia sp. IMI 203386]|nr:hypothetical protein FB645_004239 [Coemansia sp. IMI 203386]
MSYSRQKQVNNSSSNSLDDSEEQAFDALCRSKTCIVAVCASALHTSELADIRTDPVIESVLHSSSQQGTEDSSKVLAALSKHCGSLAKAPESKLTPLLEHLLSTQKLSRVYVDSAYMLTLVPKQQSDIPASAAAAAATTSSNDQTAARLESLLVSVCGRVDKLFCVKCGASSRLTQAVLFKAMCGQKVACEACGHSSELAGGSQNSAGDDEICELVPDLFRPQQNAQAANDQARRDADNAVDLLLVFGDEAEANGSESKLSPMKSVLSILRTSSKQVVLVNSNVDVFMQRWGEREKAGTESEAAQSGQKTNTESSVPSLAARIADASLGDDASAADSSDGISKDYATSSGSLDTGYAGAEKQTKSHGKGGKGRNRERTNLNHLLNFSMPARMPSPLPIVRPRRRAAGYGAASDRQSQLNKTTFINANFRFVLKPRFWNSFMAIANRPDMQLRWEWIERVIMPVTSEAVTCPICLSSPVAARVPKCGHVFCYPCILRYLSYAEKEEHGIRKCPVCWGAIVHDDLLPVHLWSVQYRTATAVSIPGTQSSLQAAAKLSSGTFITMRLMKRLRGTTVCLPRSSSARVYTPAIIEAQRLANKEDAVKREGVFDSRSFPWTFTEGALPFAKCMLAGHDYCKSEYERELSELACELIEEADDSMARMFIEAATANVEQALSAVRNPLAGDTKLEERASQEQTSLSSVRSADNTISDDLYKDDFLYFYQADDGQHIYMHPLYMRVLAHEYRDYVSLPDFLQIKLRHSVESTITDEVRHRFRFLDHLPLRCDVVFVEPELKDLVSRKSMDKFKPQITQRDKQHAARARHIAMDEARSEMLAANADRSTIAGYRDEWAFGGYSQIYASPNSVAADTGSIGAPPDESSFPALAPEATSEATAMDSAASALSPSSADNAHKGSAWPRDPLPQHPSVGPRRALVDDHIWEEFERAATSRIDDYEASIYDDHDDIHDPDDFSVEAKGASQAGFQQSKHKKNKKGIRLVLTGSSGRRRK